MDKSFVLASASPRRKELLTKAGQTFTVLPAEIDETVDNNLSAKQAVKQIALKKALAVSKLTDKPVLSADTVVVFDGAILGKPSSREDAVKMLKSLSGKTHSVLTGVAFIFGDKIVNECVETLVKMNDLSDEFINQWISSGKAYDKAGAYAVQDGGFVSRYDGSYTNVVGLPMEKIEEILKEFSLWQ